MAQVWGVEPMEEMLENKVKKRQISMSIISY